MYDVRPCGNKGHTSCKYGCEQFNWSARQRFENRTAHVGALFLVSVELSAAIAALHTVHWLSVI